MIIPEIVTINDLIVMKDDNFPERRYASIARPRIGRHENGRPRLQLIRWFAPADTGAENRPEISARLSIDIDMQPTAAEISNAGLNPAATKPIPWIEASIILDGSGFEPVTATVSLAGASRATAVINLSDSTAAVLAPLLKADTISPLQVTWKAFLRVRLPEIRVQASASVDEIKRRLESAHGANRTVLTHSIIQANAHISITGSSNPELEASLREWVLEELAMRFANEDDLVIQASASDVIRWPVHTSTTLDDIILPEHRNKLVKEIVLTAEELGKTPSIAVRALGQFDGPLDRVDVALQPDSGNDAIELSLESENEKQVKLETANFRWKHRLKQKNRKAGEWSTWTHVQDTYNLLIPATLPTEISIEVLAATLDFKKRWQSVHVKLEHSAAGSATISHIIELDHRKRNAFWSQQLEGNYGQVRATLTYLSQQGQSFKRTVVVESGAELIVPDPFESQSVQCTIVPAGSGWNEISLTMVDLRYRDNDFVFNETIELKQLDDFVQWRAPSSTPSPHVVDWRYHASFKDGRFVEIDWQSTTTGLIMIPIEGQPQRQVQILPVFFDAEKILQIDVRLSSGSRTESIVITDSNPVTVTLPPGAYTFHMSTVLHDNTLQSDEKEMDNDVIVIPRINA